MFLIPVPDNCSANQYTATFNMQVVPTLGCPYFIVFDVHTLFISSHFQSWAHRKRIKLERSTAYHPQMDGQSEIMH